MALEAVFKQGAGQQDYTPGSAVTAGEVVELTGGRAGIVKSNLAASEKGAVYTAGIFDVLCAAATTFAVGAPVIWDVSASVAIGGEGAAGDHFIGTAIEASDGSTAFVRTDLNASYSNAQIRRVFTDVANRTVLVSESGSIFCNTAAGGAFAWTLPAALPGLQYTFVCTAAQEIRIDPAGSETISLPADGVAGAAGKWLMGNAVAESVTLVCVVAGTWACLNAVPPANWTAEA